MVSGQEVPFTASQVSGDSWSVTVGKLEENTPVTFKFIFSGKFSQNQAQMIADNLFASSEFKSQLDMFIAAATGKKSDEQAAFATVLGQTAVQKALDLVADLHVVPTNADDVRKRLSAPTIAGVGLFVNLSAELDSLRQLRRQEDKEMLGFTNDMAPSAAYKAITEKLNNNKISDQTLKITAQRFIGTYETLIKQLAIDVAANLSVEAGTIDGGITEDLKKYAGIDVGALYIPRLHQLRTFATVNIYFGPVSLHPSNGTRNPIMERVSLTFGWALKDVSGDDTAKSKIKGENVFVYGIGFRLNKYFRITTGGLLYRTQLPAINDVPSPITNKLRHEFFIGPSIDITALPVLKGIFAKDKSN